MGRLSNVFLRWMVVTLECLIMVWLSVLEQWFNNKQWEGRAVNLKSKNALIHKSQSIALALCWVQYKFVGAAMLGLTFAEEGWLHWAHQLAWRQVENGSWCWVILLVWMKTQGWIDGWPEFSFLSVTKLIFHFEGCLEFSVGLELGWESMIWLWMSLGWHICWCQELKTKFDLELGSYWSVETSCALIKKFIMVTFGRFVLTCCGASSGEGSLVMGMMGKAWQA